MFTGAFGLNEVRRPPLKESYDIILKLTFRLFSKYNLVIFVSNKTNSTLYCKRRNFHFMILTRPRPSCNITDCIELLIWLQVESGDQIWLFIFHTILMIISPCLYSFPLFGQNRVLLWSFPMKTRKCIFWIHGKYRLTWLSRMFQTITKIFYFIQKKEILDLRFLVPLNFYHYYL